MLKKELYTPLNHQDGAAWSLHYAEAGLRNLVSPFAAATAKSPMTATEQLPRGTHDGTMPGDIRDWR